MASDAPVAASAAPAFPDSLLYDLLDVSLTGVNVLRPVYDPAGEIEDFAIEYLNPAGQRMTGLSAQPGGTLLTRFPAAMAAGILAYYRRAYADETAAPYEVNYQADGLDNYFRLAARRSGDQLVVSFTDTADEERSAVELALRESQAQAQAARAEAEQQRQEVTTLFQQAPACIVQMTGPTHVFTFANPGYQQLVGNRPLLGLPLDIAFPELVGPYSDLLDRVYQTGEPSYGYEVPADYDRTNSGRSERSYFNFVYQATRNAAGQVTGVLIFAHDVSEQVRARQKVELLNEELASVNEELAAVNEELRASNDEYQRTNAALSETQQHVQHLNQELEARVQARTRELEDQQRLLGQILAQVPAAITTLQGPDHRFTFANARYQQLVGGRVQPGQTVAETLPELVEQGFLELLDRVYRTGQTFEGNEVALLLETPGQPPVQYHLDFTYQPMPDPHGQPQGILVFVVDVTAQVHARRQAQALQAELLATAQRQAHEREAFHHVFEQTPAPVALLRGPGHRFEYVNPAYQAFFPVPLAGLKAAEAAPELFAQGFGALLDRVYHTGETHFGAEVPFTPVAPPGEVPQELYFNFTYQAYRENGQVAGVSIFAFEVTEQVLARQEREAQQLLLQAVFAQAPVAICVFRGPAYVLDVVNPPMVEMLGRDPAQLLGKPFFEAMPELVTQGVRELLNGVRLTGEPFVAREQEIQLARHAPGHPGFYNFVYQPLRDEQGEVAAITCVATDVTEQVRARRQVQDLNEELQTTNDELGASNLQLTRTNVDLDNFIYTASHDLKAPISNIEGLLYLLQEELPPAVVQDAEVGPTLTRMLDAVERFKRTIDHLTEVSKLQQEHAPATTLVNLAAVIDDVLLDLTPLVEGSGATLMVEVDALLPVQFSEKNLRSIVYNLLSNAIKYHSPDRPPRVDVRAHVRPGHTVLEVHDNGLGIAEAQLPRLFTMFQRFHDHVEGTGIGLYMVKRMVENAGGRIEVHSQLGAGTTFFVFLPHTTADAPSFPAYLPS